MRTARAVVLAVVVVLVVNPVFAGFEKFPITTIGDEGGSYDIDGNIFVWQDGRNKNWDIYGYDLTIKREFPICTQRDDQKYPRIDGGILRWVDARDGNYAFDLTLRKEISLACGYGGVSDNDIIVKQRPYREDDEIWWNGKLVKNGPCLDSWGNSLYAYNLRTGKEQLVTPFFDPSTFEPVYNQSPDISGNIVVYKKTATPDSEAPQYMDIYAYDLTTEEELPIRVTPFGDVDNPYCEENFPVTNGDIVVWWDSRGSVYWSGDPWNTSYDNSIVGYDLSTNTEFLVGGTNSIYGHPRISDDIVVWTDYEGVYGHDLSTSDIFLIAEVDKFAGEAKISGDFVIWTEEGEFGDVIYGAYIPEPATLSLLLAGAGFLAWKRR